MERVIYSPSIDFLAEAEKLAQNTLLPILIGDSGATKDLGFERNKVQVLKIPKEYFFGLHYETVKQGFHQSAILIDEFKSEPISNYKLFLGAEVQVPVYSETYKVRWSFECLISGANIISLFWKDSKIAEVEFNVH